MPAWLIATCATVAVLLGLVGYVWIGLRRIEALHRLYADRPTLLGALDRAGGARRGPAGDLTLAHQVSAALDMDATFERQILVGLSSNFSIVGQTVTDEFRQRLTALAEAKAASAKLHYLEDAALFFHATLSEAEMRKLISDPTRLKRTHIREGVSWLIVWSASKCVGEARGRLREEGL